MWGAAGFFITIVMVTPTGRAVAGAFAQQTISVFSAECTYPDAVFALMAVSFLISMLLMCGGTKEKQPEQWVWREVRALEADPAPGGFLIGALRQLWAFLHFFRAWNRNEYPTPTK